MLKNMCRVCGRYAALKESLRIFDNKDVLWSIQVLTGLTLENAKCLPDLICTFCQTELREAIGFSDRVIAAQQQLLTALAEEELKNVSEEYRTAVMELASNSCEKSFNTSHSGTQLESDEELILKPQLEADEMNTEEHRRQDELLEYDIIIDDEAVIQEAEVQEIRASEAMENLTDEPQCAIANEAVDVATTEDYILTDKEWNEECVISSRELNEEIAAPKIEVKKKRARKGLGNIIFVCDECGIHISGRMAFELHCRRHRGDKQFPCEVCQDRFCTSSELKSHMRRHTGERPFACQYCERSFADNSSRIKHQRTHTNERPYACTSCGKAFTAPYILKNHMLIHSGERAFSCELCNKTFRRHTHLVTHFRSSAHKRKRERQNKEIKNTS